MSEYQAFGGGVWVLRTTPPHLSASGLLVPTPPHPTPKSPPPKELLGSQWGAPRVPSLGIPRASKGSPSHGIPSHGIPLGSQGSHPMGSHLVPIWSRSRQLPLATDGGESLLNIKYLVVVWVLSICDLLFLLIFDILFIYMFWWGYRE